MHDPYRDEPWRILPARREGRAVASDRDLDAARVLVVGAARSGIAAAVALRRAHPRAKVRLIDRDALPDELPAGVEGVLGDDAALAEDCDIVVKSPGVPGSSPVVAAARAAGLPIWSEVELAFRLLGPGHPWIGITGTNGKSTTSSLTGAMLEAGGVPCTVAGNIGDAVSGLVGELAEGFQLEDVDELHPRVGVLLNVTPDHLDRHGSMEAYADAKLRMFARQDAADVAVLDDEDPWISGLADASLPGEARRLRIRLADAPQDLRDAFADSVLAGSHNMENVLCAAAAADAAGADRRGVLDAVRRFRPLAHRMERVGELGGVTYVNDSKATNQEAAIRALGAFTHGVHLILGGSVKGGDFAPLARAVATGPVSASYLIGAAADAIAAALAAEGVRAQRYDSLAEALGAAARAAAAGDTVLLAPACASFDQFRDFEDRGDRFRALVEELAA
jgi:UDP-N-acetylmuramoylalanine--D-glutamate ligase